MNRQVANHESRITLFACALRLFPVICFLFSVLCLSAEAAPRKEAALKKSSKSSSEKFSVVFEVMLDKKEYKKDEPIMATMTLANKGKKQVTVNKRFYASSKDSVRKDVYFTMTGADGKEIECKHNYEASLPRTGEFVLLEAGGQASPERPVNIRNFFDCSKPGTYSLQATYHNVFGAEIGLETATDKLVSKTITFQVGE